MLKGEGSEATQEQPFGTFSVRSRGFLVSRMCSTRRGGVVTQFMRFFQKITGAGSASERWPGIRSAKGLPSLSFLQKLGDAARGPLSDLGVSFESRESTRNELMIR